MPWRRDSSGQRARGGAARAESDTIKILFVTSGYLPDHLGGTPLHIRALVRGLGSDFEVRVLASANEPQDEEYALRRYQHEGVTVTTINNTVRDADHFFSLYAAPGVDAAFRQLIDEFEPDLVHVHHLTRLSTSILDMLRHERIPTVMTMHDYWMICPRGQRIDPDGKRQDVIDRASCRRCLRRTWPFLFPEAETDLHVRSELEMLAAWDDRILDALNRIDRIIVPSEFYAASFAEHGVERDQISVIPHGLDDAPFADVATERRPAEKTRVACLGTVIPSKGAHLLLEAAAGLGDRITVDIYGEITRYHEDDGYETRLRAAVPEGVAVTFHGRYDPDDVADLFRGIDVLVVPSIWHEAFGLTVREGFLAEVPVIVADHGGLAEAIEGDRGLGFEPENAGDLRVQLERLLDDEVLRERVRGQKAWVRSVDDMVEDTLRVYEQAIERESDLPEKKDAFRVPFREAVERVRGTSRRELFLRAGERLRELEARLDVETRVPDLYAAIAEDTWDIVDEHRVHAREVDWLRTERAQLNGEITAIRRELEKTRHALEREIGARREAIASLEKERDWLREELSQRAAEVEAANVELAAAGRAHAELLAASEEAIGQTERLGRELEEARARLDRQTAALAEVRRYRDRLHGSKLVRLGMMLARIRKEREDV